MQPWPVHLLCSCPFSLLIDRPAGMAAPRGDLLSAATAACIWMNSPTYEGDWNKVHCRDMAAAISAAVEKAYRNAPSADSAGYALDLPLMHQTMSKKRYWGRCTCSDVA